MKKIEILGSCVSRDALEFLDGVNFEITGYQARISLATLLGKSTSISGNIEMLPPGWRRRIVQADHEKSTMNRLAESEFDLLLVDLIDERFNLLVKTDGSIVTLSVEYMSIAERPLVGRVIKSGSAEHTQLWRKGFQALVSMLRSRGKLGAMKISRVYWAELDEAAQAATGYSSKKICEANDFLRARYDEIERECGKGVFIDYPDKLFVADPAHKWGGSPFHYIRELYLHAASRIRFSIDRIEHGILPSVESDLNDWQVVLKEDSGEWVVRIIGRPVDSSEQYAFYLMEGRKRVAIRWYERSPTARFSIPVGVGEYHAIGFIKIDEASPPMYTVSNPISRFG